jgi:hypothetical protein
MTHLEGGICYKIPKREALKEIFGPQGLKEVKIGDIKLIPKGGRKTGSYETTWKS